MTKLRPAEPDKLLPGDHPECRHYQACRRLARWHGGVDEWRGCRPGCLSRQDAESEPELCRKWDEVLG